MAGQFIQLDTFPLDAFKQDLPNWHACQHGYCDHPGAKPSSKIMRSVSQLIRHIGYLCFKMTLQGRIIIGCISHIIFGLMFHHPFEHLPGEIQPGKFQDSGSRVLSQSEANVCYGQIHRSSFSSDGKGPFHHYGQKAGGPGHAPDKWLPPGLHSHPRARAMVRPIWVTSSHGLTWYDNNPPHN